MPKTKVDDWSATAASNTDVGGISIQGTAPVSNMDDALREIMKQVAATPLAEAAADMRANLDAPVYVTSRTDLKALDTTKDAAIAFLAESGRSGQFYLGDYSVWSAVVTADTLEGYAIRSTFDTAKVWVRCPTFGAIRPYAIRPEWFGAVNDNSADAQPGIQCAINVALALDTALNNEPFATVEGGTGYWQLGGTISLTKAMRFHLPGLLYYTPTTGSAVVIGSDTTQHTLWDVEIGLVRAVNGNGTVPSSVNASGCTGIEIRKAQFGRFKFGGAIAFTEYGIWFNSSNDVWTGQHIQNNEINVGMVAYNGAGVIAQSASAADGAFQVNRLTIQNSFSNFRNVEIGVAADNNTNNNSILIYACDNAHASGTELRVFGSYNDITLGFGDSNISVTADAISYYNILKIMREQDQVVLSDSGVENQVTFGDGTTFGTVRFKNSGTATPPLAAESTDASASVADLVELYRNSGSPADNDAGHAIVAYLNNGSAAKTAGGRIKTDFPTVTASNENMRWLFDTIVGGTMAQRLAIWQGLVVGAPSGGDMGVGTINTYADYYHSGTKVVTSRRTGWSAATGTPTRTSFATSTVTTAQLAERVKALIDDLISHGLIGA